MEALNIRPATAQDAPAISALIQKLSSYLLTNPNASLPNWLADTISITEVVKRIGHPDYSHLVCELNQQIVGYLAMKNQNHVYHLFVDDQYHGKGIAKQLWLAQLKLAPCQHYTVRSSIFAINVYKRFGFIEKGKPIENGGIQFQPMTLDINQNGSTN